MSIGDKIWDSIATLLRVGNDITLLRAFAQRQQQRIEDIETRLSRLEGAEMARMAALPKPKEK